MKKKVIFIVLPVFLITILLFSSKIIKINFVQNIISAMNEEAGNSESDRTVVDVTNLVAGEDIEHEHVYKTMYDENNHWERCIVCNRDDNVVAHSLSTSWSLGAESCKYPNTYVKTCGCGYSKNGAKPCVWNGKTYAAGAWTNHNLVCSVCKSQIWNLYYINTYGKGELYDAHHTTTYEGNEHEWCYKADGTRITCDNPGTCATCKRTYTANNHVLAGKNQKIYCEICNKEFGTCVENVTRDSNIPATYTLSYDIVLTNGATFNATGGVRNYNAFSQTNQRLVSGGVGSTNIKLSSTAKFVSNYKSTYEVYNTFSVKINGIVCSAKTNWNMLYSDVQEPVISKIDVGDNSVWNKNRTITISGTENWTNTVDIEIIDDKENSVYTGNAKITNGSYSIVCIPDIEADGNGRTFKVFVTDECKNKTEQEFNISKIDSIAPEITSGDNVGDGWAKSKQFTFSSTDSGIGNVSIAFNDIKDLRLAKFDGEKYFRNYEFVGDVYSPKEFSVLYKDELGNTSMKSVTIYKIDNTAPTITSGSIHNNVLTMTANDRHESLGEGSGVAKYRYMVSGEKLDNPVVSSDNSIEVNINDRIIIDNIFDVKYVYVVAEDLVRKCK